MNKTNKKPHKILLIGSYGRGNIGDDAFLLAALELFPGKQLVINSADDKLISPEVRSRVTTIATGDSRDFLKKLKVFASIRSIVYCGGDLWVELYGDRMPRKSLYKMVLLNLIARMSGKRVYYLGCGIGKLSGYSLWLARLSARLANGVLVREQRSADVLGLPGVRVAPDLAINLPYYEAKRKTKSKKGKFVIGLSILYFIPNPSRNFPRLLQNLGEFIESLPKAKFKFVLLPMLVSDQTPNDDLWASEELFKRVPEKDVEIAKLSSVKDCVEVLKNVDLLIGARLHANILAALSGTPCIGISYRPKVASFFRDNNIGEYCINLDEIDNLGDKWQHVYNDQLEASRKFQQVSKQNLDKRLTYQEFTQQISSNA